MYSRNRWLMLSVLFWALVAYEVWDFALAGIALAVVGIPIGWACAEYVVIPYQYRWMVEERQGRRQDDHLNLRQTAALAVAALVLWQVMDALGRGGEYGIAIVIGSALGTIMIVGAFSKRLASISRRTPAEPTGSEPSGVEGLSKKSYRKRRHRHRT